MWIEQRHGLYAIHYRRADKPALTFQKQPLAFPGRRLETMKTTRIPPRMRPLLAAMVVGALITTAVHAQTAPKMKMSTDIPPFLTTPDWRPSAGETPEAAARRPTPRQLELFA